MKSKWRTRGALLRAVFSSSPSVVFAFAPLHAAHALLGLALPLATGAFIDALIRHDSPVRPMAFLVCATCARVALEPLLQAFLSRRSRAIERKIQDAVLDKLAGLEPSELAAMPLGGIVGKVTRDSSAIGLFLRGFYSRSITAAVTLSVAAAMVFAKSVTFGSVFLTMIPVTCLIFVPYARKFERVSHSARIHGDSAFNRLFEFFHVLPFLRMLAAEAPFASSPRNALDRLKTVNGFNDALGISFNAASAAMLAVGEISVLGYAGALAWEGAMPVGDVVACQMLFMMAAQAALGMISLIPEAASIREGFDSLGELLEFDLAEGAERDDRGTMPTVGLPMHAFDIECRNVSFSYARGGRRILSGFSSKIPAGSIVGIRGANGIGKTTLIKLMIGALAPDKGEILIDGRPLDAYGIENIRRRTGAVFQDNLLFTGTILENVTLRDVAYTARQIDDALGVSGADSVVARMPRGLNTVIGNIGQALSGGERQKIAIARALLRNPNLLVLDEVTNHLDAESRAAFCDLLDRFRGRKTVLLVSHDPEVLRRCDLTIDMGHL